MGLELKNYKTNRRLFPMVSCGDV